MLVDLHPLALHAKDARTKFGYKTKLSKSTSVMPVDEPRYLSGPSMAPAGPIRDLVLRVLASASSRGTAFPSSHVAASGVAAFCALRFQGTLGWLVTALAVGLGLGAVYGGYHYGVDGAAGAVTGFVAAAVARSLARGYESRAFGNGALAHSLNLAGQVTYPPIRAENTWCCKMIRDT